MTKKSITPQDIISVDVHLDTQDLVLLTTDNRELHVHLDDIPWLAEASHQQVSNWSMNAERTAITYGQNSLVGKQEGTFTIALTDLLEKVSYSRRPHLRLMGECGVNRFGFTAMYGRYQVRLSLGQIAFWRMEAHNGLSTAFVHWLNPLIWKQRKHQPALAAEK